MYYFLGVPTDKALAYVVTGGQRFAADLEMKLVVRDAIRYPKKQNEGGFLIDISWNGETSYGEAFQRAEDALTKSLIAYQFLEFPQRVVFGNIPQRMDFVVEEYLMQALDGTLYQKPDIVRSYGLVRHATNEPMFVVFDRNGSVHALGYGISCPEYRELAGKGDSGFLFEIDPGSMDKMVQRKLVVSGMQQHYLTDAIEILPPTVLYPCRACGNLFLNLYGYEFADNSIKLPRRYVEKYLQ